jgi:hypothetical protein
MSDQARHAMSKVDLHQRLVLVPVLDLRVLLKILVSSEASFDVALDPELGDTCIEGRCSMLH